MSGEKKKNPRVLVFGGTTESLALLEFLRGTKMEVLLSVATEYGREGIREDEKTKVVCGRMGGEEILAFIEENAASLVIDATHPFATEVTGHIRRACGELSVEYIRCLRKEAKGQAEDGAHMVYAASIQEAAEYLKAVEGNILITTGSKDLGEYCRIPDYRARCYARVLSVPESVMKSAECGFAGRHLMAMQGPFSKEMNIAAIHYAEAAFFVTKESGVAGGMKEKIQACAETGTTLVVVRRPRETGNSVEEICRYIKERYENI